MKLSYAVYQELVESHLPNYPLHDRNKITIDCYVKEFTEEEATEYINSFKGEGEEA